MKEEEKSWNDLNRCFYEAEVSSQQLKEKLAFPAGFQNKDASEGAERTGSLRVSFIQTPPQTVWAFPFHPGLLQTPLLTNIYNTDQVIDWNLCLTTFKPLQLIKISPSVSLCRIKLFSSTSSNRIICIEVVRRRFLKKNRHPPASPRVFHSR